MFPEDSTTADPARRAGANRSARIGYCSGHQLGDEMDAASTESGNRYVLGSDDLELARLDRQAAFIGPATQLLLKAAGITPGLRVLDLGTGLGHVEIGRASCRARVEVGV